MRCVKRFATYHCALNECHNFFLEQKVHFFLCRVYVDINIFRRLQYHTQRWVITIFS